MNNRIQQLRELVQEPLLVSAPVNVRYLTGFESTNAAVLIEPERVRLFTDFRYAERARSVEGVEFEETKRYLYSDLSERLPERVAFEADALTFANYEFLREGGIEPRSEARPGRVPPRRQGARGTGGDPAGGRRDEPGL